MGNEPLFKLTERWSKVWTQMIDPSLKTLLISRIMYNVWLLTSLVLLSLNFKNQTSNLSDKFG